MEALSWKQQLAVASFVAVLASLVMRFLIPGFFSTPGLASEAPFNVGLVFVLGAFFLPLLWWRTTVGYVGAIILGILGLGAATTEAIEFADAGALSGELLYTIIIPTYVFALLLIGSSVLAWREG